MFAPWPARCRVLARTVCPVPQAISSRLLASDASASPTPAAPASASGATRFVEANGQRFFVVTNGSGRPVVCLPGALGTAETDFAPQLAGLASRHQVVSFDPRGYGKSRPPTRSWPADFYQRDAEDAAAIMSVLGCTNYSVVGWSDGANAAVHLASRYPQAVHRLVIFGGNAWVEQADIDAYELTRDVKTSWSKRMLETHLPVYGEELQPMWTGFCDAMQAIMARGGDICRAEAKALRCPTLVLAGEKDPIVPMYHPRWFHENIPGARLHVFPEGKHNIHIKYAEEFNRIVLDFLAS